METHTRDPPKGHGPTRSHLQRVPLLYFYRKAEEWPELRRYFSIQENPHSNTEG